MKKVLITGTHFTPAAAVIEEFKKKKDIEVVYVGRNTTLEGDSTKSVESQVLPKLGVKFIPLIAGRLQRTLTFYTIPSLLKIPVGFVQAFFIILFERPDVILSFGGYVSVPVSFAGWLFSIPIITHEQSLNFGLANKINSLFADKIAISFEKKPQDIKNDKSLLTGNPVRNSLLTITINLNWGIFNLAKREKMPIILVMGGNQGSHVINLAIENCLPKLLKIASVIHITGDNKFEDYKRLKKMENNRYIVRKWIGEEFGFVLSKTELVVCRAGINTLSELAFLKKRGLVIPISYLYQDEQNKNAKFFENLGLVRILPQSKLSSENLLKSIKQCLKNPTKLDVKRLEQTMIPDAAKRLALETILLVKQY